MITLPKLAADALGSFLAADMKDRFGRSHARLAEIIPFAAQLTLECIGNSDALYHNVEHTMLITLAGHDIFKGRALLTASTPVEYSNFIVACLAHDIGYVRGVIKGDGRDGLVIDASGRKIALPRGSSDAALAPYHVERSKLFVLDRLAAVEQLDGELIAGAIEHTSFPYSSAPDSHDIGEWAALLRAADLVGQLGEREDGIRLVLASGYDRWETDIRAGLAAMVTSGELQPGANTDWLAASTLASLQGGLILCQARRDPDALRRALDGALALIGAYRGAS